MKYVLSYESGDDVAVKAPLHFPAHRARWLEFQDNGTLPMVGPYTDQSGAMAILTTREAAEEFASDDPFVLHGVVKA
jgi:uncharacterized protein